jgi:creatinine amidohydrolase
MRISEMHWQQVEEYLTRDDRAVVPLGCTEQHAHLSLSVDSILAERVAVESAAPLHVPVFPVLAYGITPYFRAYPGTVSLRVETYLCVVRDVLDSLAESGFRRIVLVNGHGGNTPAQGLIYEWLADHPDCRVVWHNWWNAPRTWARIQEFDPVASHASWMENFPWTRLPGVTMPDTQKPMVDLTTLRQLGPAQIREQLGDGNYGGSYQRDDTEMLAIWEVAVAETRAVIEGPWAGIAVR